MNLAQCFNRRNKKCEKFSDGQTKRRTTDNKWSEKPTWTFVSDDLKTIKKIKFELVKLGNIYLHSILSVVLAVIWGLMLLLEALHCNIFVLFNLSPVITIYVLLIPAMVVMSVDSRYQLIVGAGTALLLTAHRTSFVLFSLIVNGLADGIKDTLWTSTVY